MEDGGGRGEDSGYRDGSELLGAIEEGFEHFDHILWSRALPLLLLLLLVPAARGGGGELTLELFDQKKVALARARKAHRLQLVAHQLQRRHHTFVPLSPTCVCA
jgi:hypothetical protein